MSTSKTDIELMNNESSKSSIFKDEICEFNVWFFLF